MSDNAEDLSRQVARILKKAKDESPNHTVRSLADEMNLTPKTIQSYLSGNTTMPLPTMFRMAGLLGRDPVKVIAEARDSL